MRETSIITRFKNKEVRERFMQHEKVKNSMSRYFESFNTDSGVSLDMCISEASGTSSMAFLFPHVSGTEACRELGFTYLYSGNHITVNSEDENEDKFEQNYERYNILTDDGGIMVRGQDNGQYAVVSASGYFMSDEYKNSCFLPEKDDYGNHIPS
ncbi:MAG: hypothetical protein FWE74_10625, partial [Oscillospiraceae bacterium]|nr:hypothetical protein [Oscillospiraceae bacterium]